MLHRIFFIISLFLFSLHSYAEEPADPSRVAEVRQRIEESLKSELAAKGLNFGSKIYIRTFKVGQAKGGKLVNLGDNHEYYNNEGAVEVWVDAGNGKYKLFKSYVVCLFSGHLGPKLRSGDYQNPEGFYKVALFNPASNYHLSMNVGYPNAFDQAHGYTGSAIMIHGNCKSVGCLAMTDAKIEEIYLLAWQAHLRGQSDIPIHMFPFPMTNANMAEHSHNRNAAFWSQLKPAYDIFEKDRRPPMVDVEDGSYIVKAAEPAAHKVKPVSEEDSVEQEDAKAAGAK